MAEFTGERIIPGKVDPDLLNEHLARYAFAARLSRGKRVLDAGCGAGYGSAELAKTALSVVGADVSSAAVGFARENYRLSNLRFEQAGCSALPHPDASFDLVVAFEVIEHLKDWREFLLEVRRVLVPTGQFIVSTPNKLYYAETRERVGPNPFHEHEFEYQEFRSELAAVFPYMSLFLENHVAGVVFQPVEASESSEVRIDGADVAPAEAHFFIAVCAHRPQAGNPKFVYVPSAGNVLRERERHIDLLEDEIATKNEWLEAAKRDLAQLNRDHQHVLEMFRAQQRELEERNEWALGLSRDLEQARARNAEVQRELEKEQADAREMAALYEAKIVHLEQENVTKTQWALETEQRMTKEIEECSQELARCVEYLHEAEKTLEERTNWALQLQAERDELERQLAMARASRWLRLGRVFRLGPILK